LNLIRGKNGIQIIAVSPTAAAKAILPGRSIKTDTKIAKKRTACLIQSRLRHERQYQRQTSLLVEAY
jgi:hypothetical protein